MTLDPKWLSEILKASGWQTAALTVALGVFLLLPHFGVLPPYENWVKTVGVLGFLICACLAVSSIAQATNEFFVPKQWVAQAIRERRERKWLADYIPHMTDREKVIVAYLLAKNQKMITAAQDGGYASTLISRGILKVAMRPGQSATIDNVPFVVPDHVWEVLAAHKEQFPYKPSRARRGEAEPYPWRVHWMAQ